MGSLLCKVREPSALRFGVVCGVGRDIGGNPAYSQITLGNLVLWLFYGCGVFNRSSETVVTLNVYKITTAVDSNVGMSCIFLNRSIIMNCWFFLSTAVFLAKSDL